MIPNATESRTLQRVHWYIGEQPDYFAWAGGQGIVGQPGYIAPKIAVGRATPGECVIAPQQINLFIGEMEKPVAGGKAWPTSFDIIVEMYWNRNIASTAAGVIRSWNEAKHLAGLLFKGENEHSVGRYRDPEDLDEFLTDDIQRIVISELRIPTDIKNAAVQRLLFVTFASRENAIGDRL